MFNTGEKDTRPEPRDVEVGDVYGAKGGAGLTKYFVIMARNKSMAHALGIDEFGNICSTTSYSVRTFQERKILGHANISELSIKIEWCKDET